MAKNSNNCGCLQLSCDPWVSIQENFSYLARHLVLNRDLLRRLVEISILTRDDYECLTIDTPSASTDDKLDRILVHILPRQPPGRFLPFCRILTNVGQCDVAQRLLGHVQQDREREGVTVANAAGSSETILLEQENQTLRQRVIELERGRRRAEEETRAPQVDEACENVTEYKVCLYGEKLSSLSLRCRQLECDSCCALHQKPYRPPTMWNQWPTRLPSRKPLYGEVSKINERLVVGGYNGQVHVLKKDRTAWETFLRPCGDMYGMVSHQDGCLVLIYDKNKHEYVIDRFILSPDGCQWETVATLPPELQLKGVVIAVHDPWLFAVGGRSGAWECVDTARVCNLERGTWFPIDNMQSRRSSCTCAVVNRALYVGGGGTDGGRLCNEVEVLDLGSRKWAHPLPSTSNFHCTLSSFNGRLLATGGVTRESYSKSNTVQLYDEVFGNWSPLPPTSQVRYRHGTCALSNTELVIAEGGGQGPDTYVIESMNL